MFVSGWKWKTKRIMIPLSLPCYPWIVSVCQGKCGYKNKNKKKERKNTNRTQTKLNAPDVRYNVKVLSQ